MCLFVGHHCGMDELTGVGELLLLYFQNKAITFQLELWD